MSRLARRDFLAAGLSLALGARASRAQRAAHIVVVGGGWGGLGACVRLRERIPSAHLMLLERQAQFFSLPLSSRVLAGALPRPFLQRPYRDAARRHRFDFVQAEVTGIDRGRRIAVAGDRQFAYDYLVLAPGIRYDAASWLDGDGARSDALLARHGPAWQSESEFDDLARRLARFGGGDLLMNIPPGPLRCPPAPYERAIVLAHIIRQRGIKARLTLLDHGPGVLGFRQWLAERHGDVITHVPHATIHAIDPDRRIAQTEFADYRFDEALLLPPVACSGLVTAAGLADGAWAAQDALSLQARADERVFIVGDAAGQVSPLFGHYAKTADVAFQLGKIAADQIAVRLGESSTESGFPDARCHVLTGLDPESALQVDARYRLRADGVLTQEPRVQRVAQPRGEAQAWLSGRLAEIFG